MKNDLTQLTSARTTHTQSLNELIEQLGRIPEHLIMPRLSMKLREFWRYTTMLIPYLQQESWSGWQSSWQVH